MFTVRIDSGPSPQTSRSVYECHRYTVAMGDGGHTAALHLYREANLDAVPVPVTLKDGGIAYVMNAQGITVDVVRTAVNGRKA